MSIYILIKMLLPKKNLDNSNTYIIEEILIKKNKKNNKIEKLNLRNLINL